MPTELTPFIFEGHEVRTLTREGDPWFVLADVCAVLAHSNPSQAAAVLDEDEKHTLSNAEGIAAAQVQSLTIISEPGLYSLVLTSRRSLSASPWDRPGILVGCSPRCSPVAGWGRSGCARDAKPKRTTPHGMNYR